MNFLQTEAVATKADPTRQEICGDDRLGDRELHLPDFDFDALFNLGDDALPTLPLDLSDLPTAELKIMCNRMFGEMNKDFPRFGAREDYEVLRDELARRSGEVTK